MVTVIGKVQAEAVLASLETLALLVDSEAHSSVIPVIIHHYTEVHSMAPYINLV